MSKLDFVINDGNMELQKENNKLKEENNKLKEENKKLKYECSSLQSVILKHNGDIANLYSTIAQLQSQIQLLQLQTQGQGNTTIQPGVWRYPSTGGNNQYTVNSNNWTLLGNATVGSGSTTGTYLSSSSITNLNSSGNFSYTTGCSAGTGLNKELTLSSGY
jgi:cell division protein FtsB